MRNRHLFSSNPSLVMLSFALMGAVALGCSLITGIGSSQPGTPGAGSPVTGSFSDPFIYCAVVGTVDKPDVHYSGTPVPDEIINGFKKAAHLEASTEPMDLLRKTTIWRCMDHRVYVCNFGANLPCDSKASTDKTPSPALVDFCKANPDADVIPMSVTGHDVIYSWRCAKDQPEIVKQIGEVDAQGYITEIWYPLDPSK